jgi:hypothetical protein
MPRTALPWRPRRAFAEGAPVHYEQTVRERVQVQGQMRRVFAGAVGTVVRYDQTVREQVQGQTWEVYASRYSGTL